MRVDRVPLLYIHTAPLSHTHKYVYGTSGGTAFRVFSSSFSFPCREKQRESCPCSPPRRQPERSIRVKRGERKGQRWRRRRAPVADGGFPLHPPRSRSPSLSPARRGLRDGAHPDQYTRFNQHGKAAEQVPMHSTATSTTVPPPLSIVISWSK